MYVFMQRVTCQCSGVDWAYRRDGSGPGWGDSR